MSVIVISPEAMRKKQLNQALRGLMGRCLVLCLAWAGATAHAASAAPAVVPAAAPASAASAAATAPLVSNGLIAQLLRQVARWGRQAIHQLADISDTLLQFPSIGPWWRHTLSAPAAKDLLLTISWTLAATLVAGWAVEWLLRRIFSKGRRALVARSARVPTNARAGASTDSGVVAAPAAVSEEVALEPLQTPPGAPPVATLGTGAATVSLAPQLVTSTEKKNGGASAAEHLGLVRRFLFAALGFMLDLLSLGGFVLTTALLGPALAGDSGRPHEVIIAATDAYITARLVLAVTRALTSPRNPHTRLIGISDAAASYIHRWMRFLVAFSACGIAFVNISEQVGVSGAARLALLKVIALCVHVALLVVVVQSRQTVADWIIHRVPARGAAAGFRDWAARCWAVVAGFFIIGIWFLWALGVDNGFTKLLHFAALTAAVIIAARILSILLFGLLSRLFQAGAPTDGSEPQLSAAQRASRYYPLLRWIISLAVSAGTVVALLEVWGVDALRWLSTGFIGPRLASASLTLFSAVLIAIVIWEWANIAIDRRLARWTGHGDLVRAARLRTLLPMLRTCLLVAIGLVLGLTALNQIGINTGPLLASASIIGVALGFGSQKLVQDFITGIFLLMENAMQVGDFVTVAGVSGSVEYLSIRTVRLRAGDGSLYIVPFSSVSTVNNTNRGIGNASVRVNVPYDADIEKVEDTLKEIVAQMRTEPPYNEQILNDLELWGVDQVDGAMITLVGQIRTVDRGRWGVQREFNRRMLSRFRALDIQVANSNQRVLVQLPQAEPDQTEPPPSIAEVKADEAERRQEAVARVAAEEAAIAEAAAKDTALMGSPTPASDAELAAKASAEADVDAPRAPNADANAPRAGDKP
ncbi:MAG: mechanosensitive ion channel family protein [Janthinobacterium lividum]